MVNTLSCNTIFAWHKKLFGSSVFVILSCLKYFNSDEAQEGLCSVSVGLTLLPIRAMCYVCIQFIDKITASELSSS